MFEKILVGFDGSEAAERGLRAACTIAGKFDASVQVMHTPKDETAVFAAEAISGFYVGHTAINDEILKEAAQKMAEQAMSIAAQCGVQDLVVHIGHGNPVDDILHQAKAESVDLIVTGRRGLGDLRGLLLGSTSHGISARAECACLTVA